MTARLSALAAAVLLFSAPARANLDVVTQDIVVDTVTTADRFQATITMQVRADATHTSFSMVAPQGVVAAEVDGQRVQPTVTSWKMTLPLPTPMRAGDERTVTLRLDAVPACGSAVSGKYCRRSRELTYMLPLTPEAVWYVFNVDNAYEDWFSGTIALKLPAGHRAAASQGALATVAENADGTSTWTFPFDIETLDLAFVCGELDEVTDASGFFRGVYPHSLPDLGGAMQQIVDDAARYYPALVGFFGPGPIAMPSFRFAFVGLDFVAGGLGHHGLVFLSDGMARAEYSYILDAVPHEMAHTWFGNLVKSDAPFLSEAFAEYALWRARGEVDGAAEGTRGRRMNAVWYQYARPAAQDVAILDPNVMDDPAYVYAVYHKGSLVLRTMEEAAGTAAFTTMLKGMFDPEWGFYTADDWLAKFRGLTGFDPTEYAQKWLRATGFPKLTVTPSVVESAQGAQLTLQVAMAGDFVMKLPVRVVLPDGSRRTLSAELRQGSATITESLPAAPLLVEVDPEWTAVREIAPAVRADVSFDGVVDGADLIELALRMGTGLPAERRKDGGYDPLYDLNSDRRVDVNDLQLLLGAVPP